MFRKKRKLAVGMGSAKQAGDDFVRAWPRVESVLLSVPWDVIVSELPLLARVE